MNKFVLFAAFLFAGIGDANAAVRSASSPSRQSDNTTQQTARTTGARSGGIITRSGRTTSARTASDNTTTKQQAARTTHVNTVTTGNLSARSATSSAQRTRNTGRTATQTITTSRSAIPARTARAAVTTTSTNFDAGYNTCRDAYFTCMDQFCATQNDTYRRCVCSAKIDDIKSRERTLSQTSDQLTDFKNLNIDVIPKTAAEVKAMLTATSGESVAASARDTSDSTQKLAGISDVLSGTKTKSLSTQGTLDIAGDINAIWATTDLAAGATIANLTGVALYNAVHAQCADMVTNQCGSSATLNMVISAYNMYIENDCALLTTALDKKFTAANTAVRTTESEMHSARLDNYNAHNATGINDCVALVRADITANTACGENYVHCLDFSGKYLNSVTGAPIYTPEFYQLESSISLSGDVLTNQANKLVVAELNRKRAFANHSLDTCRDMADDVWDEFMRQAISEIYQGQQAKVRQVKEECLDVVNTCYDEQNASLKDFSNIKEETLYGSRLELSEEMCREKLNTCANLYGGGANGMTELLVAMRAITDQKIGMQCQQLLQEYAGKICAVNSNDTLHAYPYGCRTYTPGDQIYAGIAECNTILDKQQNNDISKPVNFVNTDYYTSGKACSVIYTYCKQGYYMANNLCKPCPDGKVCPGGTQMPADIQSAICGNYPNSLYQKMVRYAMQVCVRPSETATTLPSNILQDVNVVMNSVRTDMAKTLSAECSRLGGIWINYPYNTNITSDPYTKFYTDTIADTGWGYCTINSQAQICIQNGATWNTSTNTCTCPNEKVWNDEDMQCQ